MVGFLLIICISYYVVATSLIRMVGDSLFDEKVRAEQSTVAALAVEFEVA